MRSHQFCKSEVRNTAGAIIAATYCYLEIEKEQAGSGGRDLGMWSVFQADGGHTVQTQLGGSVHSYPSETLSLNAITCSTPWRVLLQEDRTRSSHHLGLVDRKMLVCYTDWLHNRSGLYSRFHGAPTLHQ
jgi:hypothetical protein